MATSSQPVRRRRSSAAAAAAAPAVEAPTTTPTEVALDQTADPATEVASEPEQAPVVPAVPAEQEQQAAPQPEAEPDQESGQSGEEQTALTTLVPVSEKIARAFAAMPPVEAPAVALDTPHLSYKPAFSKTNFCWQASSDGGKTNTDSGTSVLIGVPVDLRLEISPATWQQGKMDYRLRFQFIDREGFLVETNMNGINPKRDDPTVDVISGPARSLLGGLMMAAQSEDDMAAVANLVRLTLRPGATRGMFCDLDVVSIEDDGEPTWCQLTGARSTQLVENSVHGLVRAVTEIKQAFRLAGHLKAGPAVLGSIPASEDQPMVVAVDASQIID